MLVNTLDKVLFAILLLAFCQIPILTEHYLQFVNGQYHSVKQHVDNLQVNADLHQYASIDAMIDDFKQNSNLAVRTDAEQKQQTMVNFRQLSQAIELFTHGNLYQKSVYMFSPERWQTLNIVLINFTPGISLNPLTIVYSVIAALLLGGLLMWPIRRMSTNATS